MSPVNPGVAAGNLLLAALPAGELSHVAEQLDHRDVALHEMIVGPDQQPGEVVFPLTAICSVVVDTEEGGTVEAGIVGRDGAAPVELLFGLPTAQRRVMIQVSGTLLAGPVSLVLERQDSALAAVGRRYVSTFLTQATQGTACNRLHDLEQRAAKWLLLVHDRVDQDTFPLTHEFFALMLGAHRPSVTLAAQVLQRAGMIEYSRGAMAVTDRAALERAACECYGVMRDDYEATMGIPLRGALEKAT